MKNIELWKIAKLLTTQSGASRQLNCGRLRESLTPHEYQMAFDLRWIEPDYTTGGVSFSSQAKHLEQMREALADAEDADIGDEVLVVDSGRSYTASVSGKNPDGTLKLSFGGQKPAAEKPYKKGEYKVVKKSSSNTVPNKPAPSAPAPSSAPAAPGIGK